MLSSSCGTSSDDTSRQPGSSPDLAAHRLTLAREDELAVPRLLSNADPLDDAQRPSSGVEAVLGDFVANTWGARFSEALPQEEASVLEAQPGQHISFAGNVVDKRNKQPTAWTPARPPTPPLWPRYVPDVHQTPGCWDLAGAKAAIYKWIDHFTQFRADFEQGLLTYFNKWTIPVFMHGSRQLLRAAVDITHALKELSHELRRLPEDIATLVEKVDRDLRLCMHQFWVVYDTMTRQMVGAREPLRGKDLVWRKYTLRKHLSSSMVHIAQRIGFVQDDVRRIRNQLKGKYSSADMDIGGPW